ncbi:transposable element Tcb2 transposase [Trichonephila clavipes]|nr:transposable element Tcb2 transposase [Trichonephila clavipes]
MPDAWQRAKRSCNVPSSYHFVSRHKGSFIASAAAKTACPDAPSSDASIYLARSIAYTNGLQTMFHGALGFHKAYPGIPRVKIKNQKEINIYRYDSFTRQTVYRRLGHIGLYARRPVRCVPLTATHSRLRLIWSREHALWTSQQWSCVMFSDESRFNLQSDSHRTLIWRAPGTRYHQENTIERHRYGGAGWLVWGGIILGSRTDLHVQSVTMTGHIHWDVILEQHARLFRGAMGAEFLFMDYNARPHRANIVDECLKSEDITRMDWAAYSPDLNPIENVWDMLGRRIAARQPPLTCLPELRRALLDEWCNIPQDQIDNLILSMPRCCKACIASSGRHTPY